MLIWVVLQSRQHRNWKAGSKPIDQTHCAPVLGFHLTRMAFHAGVLSIGFFYSRTPPVSKSYTGCVGEQVHGMPKGYRATTLSNPWGWVYPQA